MAGWSDCYYVYFDFGVVMFQSKIFWKQSEAILDRIEWRLVNFDSTIFCYSNFGSQAIRFSIEASISHSHVLFIFRPLEDKKVLSLNINCEDVVEQNLILNFGPKKSIFWWKDSSIVNEISMLAWKSLFLNLALNSNYTGDLVYL